MHGDYFIDSAAPCQAAPARRRHLRRLLRLRCQRSAFSCNSALKLVSADPLGTVSGSDVDSSDAHTAVESCGQISRSSRTTVRSMRPVKARWALGLVFAALLSSRDDR